MKVLRSLNASNHHAAPIDSPVEVYSSLQIKDLEGRWKGDLGGISLDITIDQWGAFIWIQHAHGRSGYGGVTTNAQLSDEKVIVSLHRVVERDRGGGIFAQMHLEGALISLTELQVTSFVYQSFGIVSNLSGAGILHKVN